MADEKTPPLPAGGPPPSPPPSSINAGPFATSSGTTPRSVGSYLPGQPPQQIILNPPGPTPSAKKPAAKTPDEPKDGFRDVVETVVFVVVLVLLLKTFLAEAFVIPTGSMATTLLGYHIQVRCLDCGFPFTVNASREAEPQDGHAHKVVGCTCPNCGKKNVLRADIIMPP